jgi:hypothetical protein
LTGNTAALMGWASSQGLTKKEKFPCVRQLRKHVSSNGTANTPHYTQLQHVKLFFREVRTGDVLDALGVRGALDASILSRSFSRYPLLILPTLLIPLLRSLWSFSFSKFH